MTMSQSKKVAVVSDGTCSMAPSMGQEHGVHVVPIYISFGTKTYRDGVDLSPELFYRLLRDSKELPTTSQPTAVDFVQTYTKLAE